jgi:hypothetical protein
MRVSGDFVGSFRELALRVRMGTQMDYCRMAKRLAWFLIAELRN